MASKTFHIDERLHGASLGQAIKQLLSGKSWTEVKRLVTNRHVQVHGNLCLDDGRRLKRGDVIKVFDEPLNKPPEATDVAIVYRDAHLVIVEKPAGVTTQREAREKHDPRAQRQSTLDELLAMRLKQLPTQAHERPAPTKPDNSFLMKRRDPSRNETKPIASQVDVRPVHRLDRDTSGLMLFALGAQAEQKLTSMFKHHEIERVYRAVVHGIVSQPMTIESDFVRDRGDGLRGSTDDPKAPERQHAITHVKPIESIGDGAYTIVECQLETGRTHQIRIHLAERGHMLCGEQMYTRPRPGTPAIRDGSGAPRHALHSAMLSLAHPITEAMLKFESPWPKDLGRWLEKLRSLREPS